MSENVNVTGTEGSEAETGNIMQHIQDMIGDLLKNAVDKMQQKEIGHHMGESPAEVSGSTDITAQMGIEEIKGFVLVMQKFIDNVNIMISKLEGGIDTGDTDDQFLEGYIATADNVLEIAAFSMKDSLTGMSNRYGFDNRLILEWNRATRDKSAISLVIFGIDCCDSVLHDDLMKATADTLEKSIKRATDFLARWSDDEFAALLPITGLDGATIVVERITKELGSMNIPGLTDRGGKHSVSIGVCVHTPEPNEKPVDMINKAHEAFKKAKESEENSVVFG